MLRGTPDFIGKIKNIELGENDWFLALDVVSLYKSIPHNKGLFVISDMLEGYTGIPKKKYFSPVRGSLKMQLFQI